MASAKDIELRPVPREDADEVVKRVHYSGRTVPNSQIHIGVFLHGKLEGAMQFGPSMDKRRIQGIVRDTPWDGFIELNRMAFGEALPRNSESRAISIAMRLLKKYRPGLHWVISYADGTQCGDGTIYRAAGFILTQIKKNTTLLRMPNGDIIADKTLDNMITRDGRRAGSAAKEIGARPLPGFQLRYLYPLRPDVLERLVKPPVPFSEIDKLGARMYRGAAVAASSDAPADQAGEGGASPTQPLHDPCRCSDGRECDERPGCQLRESGD